VTRRAGAANANERLIRLCEFLLLLSRSKHGLTVSEVRDALRLSRSGFFRDLKVLRAAGAPIEQEEGRYRFLNAPVVPPLGLSADQVTSLQLARLQLAPLGGSVLLTELDRLLDSLQSKAARQQTSFQFAETRRALPAPKVVRAVEKALASRRRLCIEYRAATRGGEVSRIHIEPLVVSVAEADPYVRAFCVERDEERTYKLSRIQSAEMTKQRARYRPQGVPFERAVKAWSGAIQVVRVRLEPAVAWRAREYPLPGQTEAPNADGSVVLRAEVAGLVEVRSRILAWGAAAEVLEPQSLRDEVRAELAAALQKYDGPGPAKVRLEKSRAVDKASLKQVGTRAR
jgi:predicted DNA-binding transcriptional regulator YafY